MKFVTTVMLLLSSFSTPAMSLSYKEHVTLKKIKVVKDLPVNLFQFYRGFSFGDVRMIAGKFDTRNVKYERGASHKCTSSDE